VFHYVCITYRLFLLTPYAHKSIIQDPNHKIIVDEIAVIKKCGHKVNCMLLRPAESYLCYQ